MDPARLKLVLAAIWLVPGLVFLTFETIAGQPMAVLPVGNVRIPLSWIFLSFAAFNLLRWLASRGRGGRDGRSDSFRDRRRRRTGPESEPDPNFRFDDPPQ
jgi:hypothetical protein